MMKLFGVISFVWVGSLMAAPPPADGIKSVTTHAEAYGATKNAVAVDPAKDLPRYPAVEPKDAVARWEVKKGFRLELAAHEPLVRDPIAVCFDERGRMFVCEMIDYSEMRDVTPHLGRVSVLEDKDGDGFFETGQVFADNLPWPTGLIWAKGGLYVGATPDIWRFEDQDGDGKAEVREKVYTGFGTGLKILNVQGLMNSFQWGQDNRIHVLAGGGNRGKIKCFKNPELPEVELGGKDFWFDPLTHEFGLEAGGAQYGMSFDNYGRKFGCSNSDHLQYWSYDEKYRTRNPFYSMPPARKSIAVDGGAAEVFRLSPDEPWRIIRTRWRIAGVVKGAVEGGGRVSGYFTGATGTTIYRGDAYGPDFLNNSFTGDAGGQLIHRKTIRYADNGIDLLGERPADERGYEFAASDDTWVRVVNFANAPDGHLYVCDMYREIIEHPWAIPDEIKTHLDLNSGRNRGRIWRIIREDSAPEKGAYRTQPALDEASTPELIQTLGHSNGWHRDTAARLLYEKQDRAVVPLLFENLAKDSSPLAKIHTLNALDGLHAVDVRAVQIALVSMDPFVKEKGIKAAESLIQATPTTADTLLPSLLKLAESDDSKRVRFQAVLSLGSLFGSGLRPNPDAADDAIVRLFAQLSKATNAGADKSLQPALLSAPADLITATLMLRLATNEGGDDDLIPMFEIVAARDVPEDRQRLLASLVAMKPASQVKLLKAFAQGLKHAGTSIAKVDSQGQLSVVFTQAAATAADEKAAEASRLEAIALLALATKEQAETTLLACLKETQGEIIQTASIAALSSLGGKQTAAHLLASWKGLKPKSREAALAAMMVREDSVKTLLESLQSKDSAVLPSDFSASQIQALAKHKSPQIATLAKQVLASVIPPSREEVVKKFQPAVAMKGDAQAGNIVFLSRCLACHVANGQGIEVGPNMTTVKTRGRDGLLTAILEPHKEVASQYIAYTVNTKDGQTLSGIIARDDANSMTLKMMGGAEMTIQRFNIQGSQSVGQSLMPEGLEQGMSLDDMANLLSFIEAVK
ncbi:putative membrane-bound dehydrogenase domain-containing protein [Prosthecobacter debontii]|uniref:Putative membrane-bound dehydrogenase domain-containing protein n=1 Tax=Prosthecobacter debontii TaxID=48467 RepID=A0A1T4YDZ9_9BACT|nr:PVC-type heme-binding CxxCH protein [Prosthecobacter debontii]SKB00052.1 putative membrane-bound dehydrogenase domain-containing protein [Prosthecobacter debontii]